MIDRPQRPPVTYCYETNPQEKEKQSKKVQIV